MQSAFHTCAEPQISVQAFSFGRRNDTPPLADDKICATQVEVSLATVFGLAPAQLTLTVTTVSQAEVDLHFGIYERVWGVAGACLVVTIGAFLVQRVQRPGQPFQTLQREVQHDLDAVKEAIE